MTDYIDTLDYPLVNTVLLLNTDPSYVLFLNSIETFDLAQIIRSEESFYYIINGVDPYSILTSYINNKINNYNNNSNEGQIISNINLSDYSSNLGTNGELNITLPKNTLNYINQDIQTNTWATINNGIPAASISAIATDSCGNVYVGGSFTFVYNGPNNTLPVTVNNIAKWDGTTWSALAGGVSGIVNAIEIDSSGNLYAGGEFVNALNGTVVNPVPQTVNRIAKWNGTAWLALANGIGSGANTVRAIQIDSNGNVYAGGTFTNAGVSTVNNIAKWDGTMWTALASGVSSTVRAIQIDSSGNVYAGGDFVNAFNPTTVPVNRIAKWDGTTWSALAGGVNNTVNAIHIDSTGNLFVGGSLLIAYDASNNSLPKFVSRIAKWDGTTWSALAGGVSGIVNAIATDSTGNLFVGGEFTTGYIGTTTITITRIAKWDGITWSALNGGFDAPVNAIQIDSNDILYIGGIFKIATNGRSSTLQVIVNNIAKSSLASTEPWAVSLSVNNNFLYTTPYNNIINANVTDSTTAYTNGPVV